MSEIRQAATGVTSPARGGSRSAAIDGIRGLAALALMTVHVAMFSGLLGTRAFETPRPPSNFVGALLVSGLPSFIGVFFVFPALFLYLPLARAVVAGTPLPAQGANLVRRLARLLPAYYVMYAVVLIALNRDAIDGVWYVLRPIFLLQVYLPSPFVPQLMNGMEITWTVPSMVQWYLALPLIALAIHRFAAAGRTPAARARRLMLPVPVLISIGIGWLFFVKANGWDNRIVFWWPQGFAATIGIGMALAIMLALSQVSPRDTPRLLSWGASRPGLFWLAAAAVYLVNCLRPFSVIGMDAIYSTSGLLVTYLMVALFGLFAVVPLIAPGGRPDRVSTTLAYPVLAYLGRISYGVYLWHFAVMHFYLQPGAVLLGDARPIRQLYGQAGFVELWLVTFTGTVVLAALSYHVVEQPVAAWVARRQRRAQARRQATRRLPYLPRPPRPAGRGAAGMTPEQAAAAVDTATCSRDVIRANLVDLERSAGIELLQGGDLGGRTRRRWDATSTDLVRLWRIFAAFSRLVDDVRGRLVGRRMPSAADIDRIAVAFSEAVVEYEERVAPLHRRHITDDGRVRLSVAEAIEEMNGLFQRAAVLVTTVERVWREASAELDCLGEELARIRRQVDRRPDEAVEAALEAALARHRDLLELLRTDPLSMARGARIDAPELTRLRQEVADLRARVFGVPEPTAP